MNTLSQSLYRFSLVCLVLSTIYLGSKIGYAAELARVGSTVITTEQYAAALKALGQQGEMVVANPDLRKRFLDHMVNSALVADQARLEGFEKDAIYQARLQDVTKQLLAGEYMDRMLDKKMTPSAVRKYFDEHKNDFSKKEIRASHILVSTEEDAKKVLAEVKKTGAVFDEIAKKYTKDKSIDLGFFGRGRMAPEFETAAFATPKNKIHDKPIHSPFGWHVIKVVDIRGDDKVDFANVENDVKLKMRSSLQESFVRKLRDQSKVVINNDVLKDFKMPK